MKGRVLWWQWVVILVGLLLIFVAVGRWVYDRITVRQAPPPPASPEEAAREYQEQVLGYPAQPQRPR